ncbi:unnamed protein product, partial [Chondrus crispus]
HVRHHRGCAALQQCQPVVRPVRHCGGHGEPHRPLHRRPGRGLLRPHGPLPRRVRPALPPLLPVSHPRRPRHPGRPRHLRLPHLRRRRTVVHRGQHPRDRLPADRWRHLVERHHPLAHHPRHLHFGTLLPRPAGRPVPLHGPPHRRRRRRRLPQDALRFALPRHLLERKLLDGRLLDLCLRLHLRQQDRRQDPLRIPAARRQQRRLCNLRRPAHVPVGRPRRHAVAVAHLRLALVLRRLCTRLPVHLPQLHHRPTRLVGGRRRPGHRHAHRPRLLRLAARALLSAPVHQEGGGVNHRHRAPGKFFAPTPFVWSHPAVKAPPSLIYISHITSISRPPCIIIKKSKKKRPAFRPHHLAHDNQRWALQPRLPHAPLQLPDLRYHHALLRRRPPLHGHARRAHTQPALLQPAHHLRQPPQPHVNNQRGIRVHRPDLDLRPALPRVPGDEAHRASDAALRQRHAERGRDACRGCDAGHGVHLDALPLQKVDLLPAAPEHERVPALEPHDRLPLRRERAQQHVDLLLRARVEARLLAHVHHRRPRVDVRQDRRRHQPVVQNHVRARHQRHRTQRQQTRVPGPRAD